MKMLKSVKDKPTSLRVKKLKSVMDKPTSLKVKARKGTNYNQKIN